MQFKYKYDNNLIIELVKNQDHFKVLKYDGVADEISTHIGDYCFNHKDKTFMSWQDYAELI